MSKGWLIVKKQEMTKMWIADAYVPVTLVKVVSQEVVRYKTQEQDGYVSAVVGVEKKELSKEKGEKIAYAMTTEFDIDDSFIQSHQVGASLDASLFEGIDSFNISGYAIGKGFQGIMKRCNAHGMPATHGHKFTRTGWSKGNRKPRRTLKGHPHAGHMGTQRITLQKVKLIDVFVRDNEQLLVLKGSLPGAYNSFLRVIPA